MNVSIRLEPKVGAGCWLKINLRWITGFLLKKGQWSPGCYIPLFLILVPRFDCPRSEHYCTEGGSSTALLGPHSGRPPWEPLRWLWSGLLACWEGGLSIVLLGPHSRLPPREPGLLACRGGIIEILLGAYSWRPPLKPLRWLWSGLLVSREGGLLTVLLGLYSRRPPWEPLRVIWCRHYTAGKVLVSSYTYPLFRQSLRGQIL